MAEVKLEIWDEGSASLHASVPPKLTNFDIFAALSHFIRMACLIRLGCSGALTITTQAEDIRDYIPGFGISVTRFHPKGYLDVRLILCIVVFRVLPQSLAKVSVPMPAQSVYGLP